MKFLLLSDGWSSDYNINVWNNDICINERESTLFPFSCTNMEIHVNPDVHCYRFWKGGNTTNNIYLKTIGKRVLLHR